MKKAIYLDYNATSPVMPEVLQGMLPYFSSEFGNSMSSTHSHGWDADRAVEKARSQVAQFIGCETSEIVFTSGATESNNWCLRGLVDLWRREKPGCALHILASPLEHGSVAQVLNYLKDYHQVSVDFLPVDGQGKIKTEEIENLIRPETKLISVSWVQNEIGTIQPIEAVSEIAQRRGILLLSDGTQALGKIEIDLKKVVVDYFSFSAHKLGGPKGVGFLYLKKSAPKPVPLFFGGGHERGLRSETVNVPGVVGLGICTDWWRLHGAEERHRCSELQKYLWHQLEQSFAGVRLNGPPIGPERSVVNLNVTFQGWKVPASIPNVSVSKGSACSSGVTSVSATLKALGIPEGEAERTVRFSLGKTTTQEELDEVMDILQRHISFQASTPVIHS